MHCMMQYAGIIKSKLMNNINKQNTASNKKDGLFDLPKSTLCTHPEHKPPMFIHIPFGKGYRHTCPSCGKVTDIVPPQISF